MTSVVLCYCFASRQHRRAQHISKRRQKDFLQGSRAHHIGYYSDNTDGASQLASVSQHAQHSLKNLEPHRVFTPVLGVLEFVHFSDAGERSIAAP